MGIASLVLGIVSLCMSIFSAGYLGVIGTICAILGIIFGVMGRRDIVNEKMATAGLVCSIIALCLGIVLFVICAGAVGCFLGFY